MMAVRRRVGRGAGGGTEMVVGSVTRGCDVAVIGAGPGGYVAALRAAQLGKDVLLIERRERLGGVCLNEGCIPSKALIHAADLAWEARHAEAMGITVEGLQVDMPKLIAWKDGIVERLTGGVAFLCKKAGVEVLRGEARLTSDRTLAVEGEAGGMEVEFGSLILATGSSPMTIPGFEPDGERILGPRDVLSLDRIPERMVVIGAGYIGLELGMVFAKLGSKVSVVEMLPELFPGQDRDVARTIQRQLKKRKIGLYLGHRAAAFEPGDPAVVVAEPASGEAVRLEADVVLAATGRVPNSAGIGLEAAGVAVDERAFVPVNERQETNVAGIYAVGDLTGGALLAHKAYWEAKAAAEVIAGLPAAFDHAAIPAVVYTDPEIAWVGPGEEAARAAGHDVVTGSFPLRASGRAMTLGSVEGFVKVVAERESGLLLGAVAVGRGVSEIITEAGLALEMGAHLEDIAGTIHPHPTLSEALVEAVEAALGKGVHA